MNSDEFDEQDLLDELDQKYGTLKKKKVIEEPFDPSFLLADLKNNLLAIVIQELGYGTIKVETVNGQLYRTIIRGKFRRTYKKSFMRLHIGDYLFIKPFDDNVNCEIVRKLNQKEATYLNQNHDQYFKR